MSASASLRESFPSSRTCREAHLCRNTPGLVLPGQGSHGHAHSRCIRSDMMDRRENNLLLASPPHCYLGAYQLNSTQLEGTLAFFSLMRTHGMKSFSKSKSQEKQTHLKNGIVFSSFFVILAVVFVMAWISNQVRISSILQVGGSCEKAPACSRSFFLAHRRILIRL